MKKLIYVLLFVPVFVFGQGWEQNYGGTEDDWGFDVQQTTDGGYIVTGSTYSVIEDYHTDVFLVKTDINGDTLWTRFYNAIYFDGSYSVRQTSDEGYVIAGSAMNCGYLIKTNSLGDTLWTKMYNPYRHQVSFYEVQLTTDGGYIMAGVAESWAQMRKEIYIVKSNNLGDTLWTKLMGQDFKDQYAKSIQQTSDGGYILTGYSNLEEGIEGDAFLLKTDSYGDTLWCKIFGGANIDMGEHVQQTSDGGYILTGFTASAGNGNRDVYLIKTDEQGEILWTRTYGGESSESGNSVRQIENEGYIISGQTSTYGNGNSDAYIIRTDDNGDTLWTQTYGGSLDDKFYSIQQTTDGGFIMAGITESFGNKSQFYLVKIDANGNISAIFDSPFLNSNRKLLKTVDFLGREIQPQKNIPYIEVYEDGSTEKKLIVK